MYPSSCSTITSIHNPLVKKWQKLLASKGRKQSGLCLVETEHLVHEASLAKALQTQLITPNYQGKRYCDNVIEISPEIAKKLSQTVSTSTVFGIVEIPQWYMSGTRFLYLDDVSDPGNVGTLIRSALSFGYDGLLVSEHCVDLYNDKVIRSSQGAIFALPNQVMSLDELMTFVKQHQLSLVVSDVENGQNAENIQTDRLVCVLGNEARGVSAEFRKQADQVVKIQTVAFESLNVAIAGSILMYLSRKTK